ncbi:MAG: methylated-DNA--[protein]-cysteine S-methyltransferase [Treponema sp.]|nr:methylated-DNA--[protein]-cysteine S-methyltransferase [Treponema sp.]
MKKFILFNHKFCNLFIAEENGVICDVSFKKDKITSDYEKDETKILKETIKQLGEYFDKKRKNFNLPISLHGTDFQIKVWNALKKIPYGETCSYTQLAAAIGNPKACRAVGMANNKNPAAIIIPCHRVIGSNGSLTGYAGGLEIKKRLLDLEKTNYAAQPK